MPPSSAYISLLELGKHYPSLVTLFVLAEAPSVKPSEPVRPVERAQGR